MTTLWLLSASGGFLLGAAVGALLFRCRRRSTDVWDEPTLTDHRIQRRIRNLADLSRLP